MKNLKDMTFSKWVAAIILVICILILTAMHFWPGAKGVVGDISPDAIKATGALCGFFLFGSTGGSQAKDAAHADTTAKMIDALQNSTPIVPSPVAITPVVTDAPVKQE